MWRPCRTPEVDIDTCFMSRIHGVKTHWAYNRQGLDHTLLLLVLFGFLVWKWFPTHKKLNLSRLPVKGPMCQVSLLEVDTMMCRSIFDILILAWMQFYEEPWMTETVHIASVTMIVELNVNVVCCHDYRDESTLTTSISKLHPPKLCPFSNLLTF